MFTGALTTARLKAIATLMVLSTCGCAGKTQVTSFVVHGDASELFGSGTRLKAHYLDGGSGARYLIAFHDTELGIECNFVETSQGRYACLPLRSLSTFAGSSCTQPVVQTPQSFCNNEPSVAAGDSFTVASTDCSALQGVFSAVEQEAVDSTSWIDQAGSCTSHGALPSAWSTKSEPLTQFVRGTASLVGAPEATQAVRVTAEDGAFTNLALTANGEPCTAYADLERCVPGPVTQRSFIAFVDASCSEKAVAEVRVPIRDQCIGAQPRYLVETSTSCAAETAVHALGDRLDPYVLLGGCQLLSSSDPRGTEGNSYYRIGKPVSSAEFAVVHAAALGTGELTVRGFTDGDGVPIRTAPTVSFTERGSWALRDGTRCNVLLAPDGQLHCVPQIAGEDSVFSDAGCTQPLTRYRPGCPNAKIEYLAAGDLRSCPPRFDHIFAAREYSGPVYRTSSTPGQCIPDGLDQEDPPPSFLSHGEAVSPDHFPLVLDTTDQ